MKKTIILSAVFLYISMFILTVKAQTTEPSNANSQNTSTLIGQVLAVIGIVVVFSIIAYAGFKILRKWGNFTKETP
jgi:hypothetical protein